jgi:hypothetical protein
MIEAIEALDLGPIKFKLMDPQEGEGWSRAFVEHLELQYKRYLTLVAKYPREAIAPGKALSSLAFSPLADAPVHRRLRARVGFHLHHPTRPARAAMRRRSPAGAHAPSSMKRSSALPGRAGSAFCSVAARLFARRARVRSIRAPARRCRRSPPDASGARRRWKGTRLRRILRAAFEIEAGGAQWSNGRAARSGPISGKPVPGTSGGSFS